MNPKTRMSTAQRALELAVRNNVRVEGIPAFDEAAKAIEQSGAPDPAQAAQGGRGVRARRRGRGRSRRPALQLVAVDEEEAAAQAEAEAQAAEQAGRVAGRRRARRRSRRSRELSPAGKIRLATLGNAFARAVLIRDTNKQVAMACDPLAGGDRHRRRCATPTTAASTTTSSATSPTSGSGCGSTAIKVALCNNPKCPLPVAMRFLPHLNVRDLKALSRSKGIPVGAVPPRPSRC